MSNVVIRRPHPPSYATECAAATAIFLEARRAALSGMHEPRTERETRAWMGDVVFPRYSIRIAEADGQMIGYAARDGAWLMQLYVKPEWTGKGVGKSLLDAIVAEVGARIPILRVRSFQRNAGARQFFERHGFVVTSSSDGANNEEREPDLVLERTLAGPA